MIIPKADSVSLIVYVPGNKPLVGPAPVDDEADKKNDAPLVEQFKVTFTDGMFVKPEQGFLFDKKTKVRFTATLSRKPDMRESKMFAKLYAVYNDKTEDLRLAEEGRLRNDGTWEAEFKLRTPQSWEKDNMITFAENDSRTYF